MRLAKAKWVSGDVTGARDTLKEGFKINLNSEAIWLAAVKLEVENNEYERGKKLLDKARNSACSAKVMMRSAQFYWHVMNDLKEAERLLDEGMIFF